MPLEWSQEREEEMGLISKAFERIDQALLLIMKSWMNIQQKSYWISFGWMFQAFVFENISHKFSAWKLHCNGERCDSFTHMYQNQNVLECKKKVI